MSASKSSQHSADPLHGKNETPSSPRSHCRGSPQDGSDNISPNLQRDSTQYVKDHQIHVLLDQLIKGLLVEKPQDSTNWMLRWFVEKHRVACENKLREKQEQ